MMAAESVCPDCGAAQPANAPAGLCPQCLLKLGLGLDSAAEERGGVTPPWPLVRPPAVGPSPQAGPPPSAAHGPSRISGILTSLDQSLGPIPRVLLRDGPTHEVRPIRPGSEEMPDLSGDGGRYQLLGELARGGIGAILKGRDVDLGRDLAVKVLLEKHRDHPEMVRRFVEEAQIGGQLQHPGIVPVHELGRFSDGRLYIAMKLVEGRTLAVLLETRKDPADDRARFLSIFEQVCQTMAYAHARGVIHRDLKPSNVMVGSFGEIQVMDWGLAKVLDQGGVADEARVQRRSRNDSDVIRTVRTGSQAGASRAGSVLGTPAYMAPEQARGAVDTLDERADVFGLGSILCEILTGQPAFTGRTSVELYEKAERAELGDARARLDACGADGELVALTTSCLAAAPKDRPRDAGVVATGLTAYLAGAEQRLRAADLARAQAEARAAGERRRRLLTLALAASVLAIVVLAGTGWARWVHDRAARAEAASLAVNQALDEAVQKRDQARAEPGGDPTRWVEAIAAARRAEVLLHGSAGRPELQQRVRDVLVSILSERGRTEAAEKDRRMVERLAEIHDDLGVHLDWSKADDEYAAAFRDYGIDVDALEPAQAGARLAARPVAVELANALDQWAFLRGQTASHRRRRDHPHLDAARRLVAVAKGADPDPWRNRLRDTLYSAHTDQDQTLASLLKLAATADPDHLPEASVTRLAFALSWPALGKTETAIALLRRAQRVHPSDFWLNIDLANQLLRAGELEDAIRFYAVAVSVRPRSGLARNSLALALHARGRLEDAAATFRQAIRVRPDDARAHIGLGGVLLDQGEPEKATVAFAAAKAIGTQTEAVHCGIADTLANRGEWDAAIAELRGALRSGPWDSLIHDRLGRALLDTGRPDEAITSFREAIRLNPHSAPTYGHLGRALLERGELAAAVESFRRAHYGAPEPDPRFPSAARLREAERMLALDARLPALLRGADQPADAGESAAFARLCSLKQRFAAATRLWTRAFAAQPGLADDFQAENRSRAARTAALAGCGRGQDDLPADAAARPGLRRQALAWLEADLAASAQRLESHSTRDRAAVARRLGRWRTDPALAPLRDEAALARLPEPERRAWQAFWSQVEALRIRAMRLGLATNPGRPF